MKKYDPKIQREKAFMNGGGDSPITKRQIMKIEQLARELSTYGNALTQKKYGKSISELIGSEANELIRNLLEVLGDRDKQLVNKQ